MFFLLRRRRSSQKKRWDKLNVKQPNRRRRKFVFLVVELGLYCDVAVEHFRWHHLTFGCRFDRADPGVGRERLHWAHGELPLFERFAFELGTLNNSEISELFDGAEVDFPENCLHVKNVGGHASFVDLIWVGEVLRLLPNRVTIVGVGELDPVAKNFSWYCDYFKSFCGEIESTYIWNPLRIFSARSEDMAGVWDRSLNWKLTKLQLKFWRSEM